MTRVSAVVNTLNEERHLRGCLESLRWADEIVLVDMHSDDQTRPLAESFGCRVLLHERTGYVEPARQFAVDAAAHDWVLVVDADERASPGLATWIRSLPDPPAAQGYRIPRRNFYGARWMTCCGWFPDAQLRFFHRRHARFSDRIHRGLAVAGRIEPLPVRGAAYLEHLCFESLEDRFGKDNHYSSIAAAALAAEGRQVGAWQLIARTFAAFVRAYCLHHGWRAGGLGAVLALERGVEAYLKYAKVWERGQRSPNERAAETDRK